MGTQDLVVFMDGSVAEEPALNKLAKHLTPAQPQLQQEVEDVRQQPLLPPSLKQQILRLRDNLVECAAPQVQTLPIQPTLPQLLQEGGHAAHYMGGDEADHVVLLEVGQPIGEEEEIAERTMGEASGKPPRRAQTALNYYSSAARRKLRKDGLNEEQMKAAVLDGWENLSEVLCDEEHETAE